MQTHALFCSSVFSIGKRKPNGFTEKWNELLFICVSNSCDGLMFFDVRHCVCMYFCHRIFYTVCVARHSSYSNYYSITGTLRLRLRLRLLLLLLLLLRFRSISMKQNDSFVYERRETVNELFIAFSHCLHAFCL